jgi:hypothetical protein
VSAYENLKHFCQAHLAWPDDADALELIDALIAEVKAEEREEICKAYFDGDWGYADLARWIRAQEHLKEKAPQAEADGAQEE